ncbi:putative late blight resistance protein homolog R1B-23 isoform X2 [Solanum stenotomum]|uniref:putative late blight resistance protein homolog R1B-23 isoform X2 n=1 Tax=Solanum stenotomum TaxID=172797 RepID=UPI0020D12E1A|nr:putative late blight resistance protein homolog R1B-23 isoform X2 [Solanum stenotomum]
MTDAGVNFLVGNLLDLLSGNIDLIRGVDDEFKNLLEEVQRLKAFLDDDAKFHSESSLWDQLVKEIQKMVHKSEDVIDKFLIQSKLHRDKNKVGRFFDVGHMAVVRDLAAEIKDIHEKVKKLRQDHTDSFSPKPLLDIPEKAHQVTQGPLEDDVVVGFDEEAKEVIERLVKGQEESLDIIPVVGMAGLGKTTLARKICNDSKLSLKFCRIIWVNVGLQYKIKDIYLTILNFFTEPIEDHLDKDVDALAKTISDFMNEGGRCLIVLDDVWVAEVVDAVKKVFPRNKKGDRIMLTTRDVYLATYANRDPHKLEVLTPSNRFELLEKRAFGNGKFPVELVELGEKIAQRCGGVPLATVLIAGLLRGLRNKSDWVRVESNVPQHLHNNDYDFALFIEMSYDRLPEEMQTCFLYCGIFPRGFDIPAWKLIRLWIAEGLIKPQQSYTLEEIAELHLNDLVHRNLVILLQKTADGRIKTCRLHDLLHKFCRTMAANKWLFQEIYTTPDNSLPIQDPDTCRRLCIHPSTLYDFLSTKPYAEHVRSFYCFSSKQKPIHLSPTNIKLIHKAFPLMRVLDVESFRFVFSKDFNQLFHLRYIAISGEFKALPPPFGNFWNLQTLILNTSTSEPTLDVKADIWNLLQLRHLHSNIPAKLPSPTITTGKPSCLQTLSLVASESCKKDVFAKACFLKKLSIRGQMAAFFESRGGISNLEELKCLEHLKLLNDVLYMNKTIHLPATFFRLVRTVNKLTLANTRFSWSEADKLGQLESLEVLKLKQNAFVGNSWKPKVGGFRKLQVLWIESSAELESWEVSDVNFPMLSHLVLISCDKLDALPIELADLPNFQEMRLEKMSKAIESAKAIEERKTSKSIKFKLTISC